MNVFACIYSTLWFNSVSIKLTTPVECSGQTCWPGWRKCGQNDARRETRQLGWEDWHRQSRLNKMGGGVGWIGGVDVDAWDVVVCCLLLFVVVCCCLLLSLLCICTKIDAGQVVLLGNFLGSNMLLDGDWIVCAALHSGIIGNNNTLGAKWVWVSSACWLLKVRECIWNVDTHSHMYTMTFPLPFSPFVCIATASSVILSLTQRRGQCQW